MTHPRRLPRARALAERLGLDSITIDPDPGAAPSAMRTAMVAWDAAVPGATHLLVVQDDIAGPASLLGLVHRAVRRHPAEALAFYAHGNTRNGAAVRLAALAGAGWIRGVPEEFTPTQAVCLPVAMAEEFRHHARGTSDRHDDEVLSSYLRRTGRMCLLAVPNLVEHVGTESLTGHDVQGIRRAACLTDAAVAAEALGSGWVLEETDCLPYMRQGLAHVRAVGPDGVLGPRGHARWREALAYLGLDLAPAHGPADLATAVSTLFGAEYAQEFWLHCFLLGRQARLLERDAVPALREAAVATLGVSSLPPETRPTVAPAQADLLRRYAREGLRCGRQAADLAGAGAAPHA